MRKIKDRLHLRLFVVNLTSPKLECVRSLGHNTFQHKLSFERQFMFLNTCKL